jgi:hypothetical protein
MGGDAPTPGAAGMGGAESGAQRRAAPEDENPGPLGYFVVACAGGCPAPYKSPKVHGQRRCWKGLRASGTPVLARSLSRLTRGLI